MIQGRKQVTQIKQIPDQNPSTTFKLASSLSLAVAISAAMASPAMAQQGDTPEIEEIQVISTSRRPENLSDVNASVAILSEEALRLVNHTHIQEAANRLPGVNINRNTGERGWCLWRIPDG